MHLGLGKCASGTTAFDFGYKKVELPCARQEAGPWPSTLCFCLPWATRASSKLTKGFHARPRKGFEHGPGLVPGLRKTIPVETPETADL